MRQSTRFLINASINVASGLVNMGVRLVVVPLTVHYIGKEAYGVYALIGGLALYTPYLNMGMASAVTRYTAVHLARKEYDEMNAVVNTGIAYYRVMAFVFLALTLLIAAFGIQWFIEDPDLHYVARLCAVVFALFQFGVMMVGPVGGILRAIERFDLYSLPVTAFRLVRLALLAAILPWCGSKSGVVVVTAVMVGTNFLPALTRRILAGRYTPNLKYRTRLASKRLVWPMISFGIGSVTWQWAMTVLDYLPLLLIGWFLTTRHVTEYQVPASILLLVNMLVGDVMNVMSPTASKLDATGRRGDLQELFLRSSKYAAGVSFAGCAGMGLLSLVLLHVWVGENFHAVAIVLTLLAAGRGLYYVQISSFFILIGMAKQRIPAVIAVTCVAAMGALQAVVLGCTGWGLVGVAAATSVTLTVGYGLAIPLYACRQIGVGFGRYCLDVVLRPALSCVPAAAAWAAMRLIPLDYGWLTVALALSVGGALAVLGWWYVLFDDWDRRLAREKLTAFREKVRRLRSAPAADASPHGPESPEEE